MGRHAGFIAAHAALASGDVDLGDRIQFFVFNLEHLAAHSRAIDLISMHH
jgi:6-phosphofructokinase